MYKLLIVDDDIDLAQGLALNLVVDFDIHLAMSGHDAQTTFEHNHPDVVLIDQVLDDMMGVELIYRFSKLADRPAAILYSAVTDVSTVRRAIQAGASDVVSKPFDLRELRSRLLVALACRGRRAPPSNDFRVQFADLLQKSARRGAGGNLEEAEHEFTVKLLELALVESRGDRPVAAAKLGIEKDQFEEAYARFTGKGEI